MKVGLFTPAYRGRAEMLTGYEITRSVVWAIQAGHEIEPWTASGQPIHKTRNDAIKRARERGHDRLMMLDADCYSDTTMLAHLMEAMDATGAAAVGAVFALRDGGTMNVTKQYPTELREVDGVGTGCLLIDMHKVPDDDPFDWSDMGEDLHFCRYLRELGHKVYADFRNTTYHVGEIPFCSDPVKIASLLQDPSKSYSVTTESLSRQREKMASSGAKSSQSARGSAQRKRGRASRRKSRKGKRS